MAVETIEKQSASEDEVCAKLLQSYLEALDREMKASETFDLITKAIIAGRHREDGVERIQNAYREVSSARIEARSAYNRLNDYLAHGTVPNT